MVASVGARIVVESERAAQSGRSGVIEEVLAQDPPRFRIRWDDGRTSIFAPSAGVARIERKRARAKAYRRGRLAALPEVHRQRRRVPRAGLARATGANTFDDKSETHERGTQQKAAGERPPAGAPTSSIVRRFGHSAERGSVEWDGRAPSGTSRSSPLREGRRTP